MSLNISKPRTKVKRRSSTSSFGTVARVGHNSDSFYRKKIYSSASSKMSDLLSGGDIMSGVAKVKTSLLTIAIPDKVNGKRSKVPAANGKSNGSSNITSPKEKYQDKNNVNSKSARVKSPVIKSRSRVVKNMLYCGDSRDMKQLPDNSIQLMITSPPYNVGKEYDDDLDIKEYATLLRDVFKETYRVLVEGGRACINIANIGRKPYIPLHSLIISIMAELDFIMRGEIIWDKGASAGSSCAWGSWCSATNPVLRDVHEYILIYSKESLAHKSEKNSTISKQDFLDSTKSIWRFSAANARRLKHPAPFPVELPRRLIELYSFKGDIVLDPFVGSGSSCIAAVRTDRNYVGYDLSQEYIDIANSRLEKETENQTLDFNQ